MKSFWRPAFRRALLITLATLAVLGALPGIKAANEVMFTAVNNTLLPLSAGTMPVRKNGVIYVPYTVFTGEIGLKYAYKATQQTLVIYTLDHTLTFQIAHGYVYDEKMESYSQPAYYINNTVYVPSTLLCNKFGLSLSIIPGTASIVRITDGSSGLLSDDMFVSMAEVDNGLEKKIREYEDSLKPGKPDPVKPETPSVKPEDPVAPPDETVLHPSVVYLTFEGAAGKNTEQILSVLQTYGRKGTFFLTPESVAENGDIVRRIAGEGHSIGFCMDESLAAKPEELVKTLQEANDTLLVQCGLVTRLVRIEGGSRGKLTQEGLDVLIGAGYRLWDYTQDSGDDKRRARQVYNAVLLAFRRSANPMALRFGMNAVTPEALKLVIGYMRDENIYSASLSESDTPMNFYDELR